MKIQNFSELQKQQTQREENIKKIQQEIEALEEKEKLNKLSQEQNERLSFLLSQLRELKNIPEFDVKKGWENFKKDYLPIAEEFLNEEKKQKQKKKRIFKNAMNISFVFIFIVIFAGGITGRTGFVNYFIRNTQETKNISDKSIEEIQKEIDREYETLEKEYGIKIGKINLPFNEYRLQDYVISEKYISITYLNINTEENIVFSIYKDKQASGQINIEHNKIIEIYLFKDIIYNIIENMGRYYISWEKDEIYYILQNCSNLEESKNMIENITY
ncbi:hypothetical protein AAK894_09680 [Lachnospiraceae bacterium 46-61]